MTAPNPIEGSSSGLRGIVATGTIAGFLKLDGIDGESVDARHRGEIEIRSSSFGAANAVVVGGGGGSSVGKVRLQELHVVKAIDKASPRLFVSCVSGRHLKSATLTWRRAGAVPVDFLVITLEDIVVTSIQDDVTSAPGVATTEAIALAFGKIVLRYVSQKPDGSPDAPVVGGWDARTNREA